MAALKLTKRMVDPITFDERVGLEFVPRLEDFCLDDQLAGSMSYAPPREWYSTDPSACAPSNRDQSDEHDDENDQQLQQQQQQQHRDTPDREESKETEEEPTPAAPPPSVTTSDAKPALAALANMFGGGKSTNTSTNQNPTTAAATTTKTKKRNISGLFQRKVQQMIVMNRLFGHKNYDKLAKAEKNADQASYKRSAIRKAAARKATGEQRRKSLRFSENLIVVFEIEDLTRKNTTWGDVWEDLYLDEETLASIKYEAFEQECRRADEGYVTDDYVEPYTNEPTTNAAVAPGEEKAGEEEAAAANAAKPPKRNLKNLFRKKVKRVIIFQRMFGGYNIHQLDEKERRADIVSFGRSRKEAADKSPGKNPKKTKAAAGVSFKTELVVVYEIEDLTKRNTSWGDIWDDLYFDEETLAEFKYNAFMEEVARENGEFVSDDE